MDALTMGNLAAKTLTWPYIPRRQGPSILVLPASGIFCLTCSMFIMHGKLLDIRMVIFEKHCSLPPPIEKLQGCHEK